jgi:tetratricopeptide (TPR) repeat protein
MRKPPKEGPGRKQHGRVTPALDDDRRRPGRKGLWLLAIFAFGLLLRLIVLHRLLDLPLHRTPQLDSLEYLIRAEQIRLGNLTVPDNPAHGPGYPFFAAGVLSLFEGSLTALGVAQSLLGAALCVLVAGLVWRWFGRQAGILAGLLLAVNGPVILIGTSILAEGLLLFLLILSLWIFESGELSPARAAVAGALIGLAGLVRPTALAVLPLVAALAFRRGGSRRSGWVAAGTLTAAALLMVLPVVAASWRKTGSLFLIQGNGGLSFYLGNSPWGRGVASGRLGGSWDAVAGEAVRVGLTRPADQDRYYTAKALKEIYASPGAYARLLGKKILLTFQDEEVRDSHSYYFFVDRIPLLRWLPGFGLVFSLASCGVVIAVRNRRLPPLAIGCFALFSATCAGLVVGTRYRMPLVPFVVVFGALGASGLIAATRLRNWREALILCAVLALALGFTHTLRDGASRNLAEEWYFTGNSLIDERDLAGAADAYERALAENPAFAPALGGLGVVSLKRDDWESAARRFESATAADPGWAKGHYWLGLALQHRRLLPEAARELRRARDLRPDDGKALLALAQVLSESRLWDEAATVYRAFFRLRPDDAAAHLALARVEAARHGIEAGSAEAARATQLDPVNADAWLLRATFAIDAGEPALAQEALQRAEIIAGPGKAPIIFAWALLERLRGRPDAAEARLKGLLAEQPDFLPAAQLFLQNAAEQGRRAQAEAYLRSLSRSQARPAGLN